MANVYVDFTATFNGDGTDAAQAGAPAGVGAFNTITSVVDTANDKVWIRRAGSETLTTTITYTTSGMEIIGWPISTDDDYSTRPASGTSAGWDSDGQTHAIMDSSTDNVGFIIYGTDQRFKRIDYINTGTSTTNPILQVGNFGSGPGINVKYCIFETSYVFATNIVITQASDIIFDDVEVITNQTTVSNAALDCISYADNMIIRNCNVHENTLGSYCIGIRVANETLIENTTINITGPDATGINMNMGSSAGYLTRIYDCTIDIDDGEGISEGGISYINPIEIRTTTVNAKSLTLSHAGGGTSSMAFTQTNPNTGSYGIQVFSGIITFENLTFQSGNSYDFDIKEGALVLVRNGTFLTTPPNNSARRLNPGLYVGDISANLGFFKSFHNSGTVETSSVARTGGRGFSMKMSPENGVFSSTFLRIGLEGMETILVPLTAGSRTLTVYGAHKLWGGTPPLDNELYFECDYISSGSGATRTLATSKGSGSTLTADGSSWTGDTGLTTFSMSITFSVGQNCVAPIRVYLGKFVSSAYVYIDPLVVIV